MKLLKTNFAKTSCLFFIIGSGAVVAGNLIERRRRAQDLAYVEEQCNEMVAKFEETISKISKL